MLRPALLLTCVSSVFSFGLLHDPIHWAQTASHVIPHTHHHAQSLLPNALNPQHILHFYAELLAKHPLETKMATGATLAVAGDAIAQSRDDSAPYDTSRAVSFGLFDSAYRALQHVSFPFIVQHCHGQFIGAALASSFAMIHVDSNYLAAMEQTLASQLGIVPFLYYPVFFAMTAAVQGLDGDGAVQRAKENFVPLMKRNLLFWIPVQFVQFGFVPEALQIPFLSACGLAWTFILSLAAGSAKQYSSKEMEHLEDAMITAEMNEAITNVLLKEQEDEEERNAWLAMEQTSQTPVNSR